MNTTRTTPTITSRARDRTITLADVAPGMLVYRHGHPAVIGYTTHGGYTLRRLGSVLDERIGKRRATALATLTAHGWERV